MGCKGSRVRISALRPITYEPSDSPLWSLSWSTFEGSGRGARIAPPERGPDSPIGGASSSIQPARSSPWIQPGRAHSGGGAGGAHRAGDARRDSNRRFRSLPDESAAGSQVRSAASKRQILSILQGSEGSAAGARGRTGQGTSPPRPYTPRTNGKAERFIQTALREWAYARAYSRSHQRIAALPPWLHGYNWHRHHASLAGPPPVSRLGLDRNNLMRLHS